jgi:hypothetical protein
VGRANWREELERAYRAVVTLNEKSEPLGATVGVTFSSYEGRNYRESWKRARELLPGGFGRYEVGYIYVIEGLEDLDFTRRTLTPEKPVAEIELGRFRHTADFDDHPDLAAEGLLQMVVGPDGLGVAIDLHQGPLPEALAKLFPGGLEEVQVGEIPGYRKGKVVKKKAAKKKAAKKRKR